MNVNNEVVDSIISQRQRYIERMGDFPDRVYIGEKEFTGLVTDSSLFYNSGVRVVPNENGIYSIMDLQIFVVRTPNHIFVS